jgi:hypothetical protein
MLVLFIFDSPQFFDSDYDASHKSDDLAIVYDEGPAFSDQGEARQDMRKEKSGGRGIKEIDAASTNGSCKSGFSLREFR